jgi:hypothetical protein
MKTKRLIIILSLSLVVILSIAIRTFDYKNTSLDYDEHKTIINELELIDSGHIFGYLTLKNMWDYKNMNKYDMSNYISICFPLYYLPMKMVTWLQPELSLLRLATIAWGILSVFSFYILGNMFGVHVGWIAFTLILLHPWAHHHAIHIRFYECWALVSILGLLCAEMMIRSIKKRTCSKFQYMIYALMIILPCTVHAYGVVNSLFILIYTFMRIWKDKIPVGTIRRSDWLLIILTLLIGVVVVGVNMAVYGYATLFYGQTDSWNNSSSALQIVGSFIFNSGYLLPFIIVGGISLIIMDHHFAEYSAIIYLSIVFMLSLLPTIPNIILAPNTFRPDYLYGTLPYVLLITALSINAISRLSFQGRYIIWVEGFLTALVVLSTFPTFVSNLLIDKDRLPHDIAAKEIAAMSHVKVFAPNPNYFNYYLDNRRVDDIQNANRKHNDSRADEFFYIPVRKGMSTQFFYDFNLIDDLRLYKIIGKDRIDLRGNHIYVFIRKAIAK